MQNMHSPDVVPWSERAAKEVQETGRISFTTGFVLQEAGIDIAVMERRLLDQQARSCTREA